MSTDATAALNLQIEEELLPMAGGVHGEIEAIVTIHLGNYVYENKLGRVFGSQTTFELPPVGRERQPDVAFVKLERLPVNVEGNVPLAPDLAVEVNSPTDDWSAVEKKVLDYLQGGVRLVWVISAVSQAVFIYHPASRLIPKVVGMGDELDGEEVIPGFKLKVSQLFD